MELLQSVASQQLSLCFWATGSCRAFEKKRDACMLTVLHRRTTGHDRACHARSTCRMKPLTTDCAITRCVQTNTLQLRCWESANILFGSAAELRLVRMASRPPIRGDALCNFPVYPRSHVQDSSPAAPHKSAVGNPKRMLGKGPAIFTSWSFPSKRRRSTQDSPGCVLLWWLKAGNLQLLEKSGKGGLTR